MDDKPPERVSIWSVLAKYWSSFVWVLIAFLIVWTSVSVAAYDFVEVASDSAKAVSSPFKSGSVTAVALVFVKDFASYTIGTIMILAVVLVLAIDGRENLKVTLTRWLREKVNEEQRAQDRAEGASEGRNEMHEAWYDWYRRFLKARENHDEPFDEPPPKL